MTIAPVGPAAATMMFADRVSTGGGGRVTVTVKTFGVAALPEGSDALQVTVVAPTAKE